ncbi:hypothetical protein FF011L_29670 [Roseimaritima multifibrata]|uniref:Uncharacterized protein n=1 Tax=Roseimaritima multifibrata TaxID=1930274 RepID=A0A517MH37_9BACT|nr:hypothetical protein [Roseimaritima multifibrata]QDS94189.1 hypothetical protein FF011L_29670 [Roseimaritima multifibrata]
MAAPPDAIGFYTVQQCERVGWTGGYLMLNAAGRPLEFHCTLPVRPSRAHEILFGPTLREHIIGEAIGCALLPKARVQPILICCDQPEGLHLDVHLPAPIGLVSDAACSEEGPITADDLPGYEALSIAGSEIWVAMERAEAMRAIVDRFADLPDLIEPFGRIREAIQEAQQQVARAA